MIKQNWKKIVLSALLLLGVILFSSCSTTDRMSTFDTKGPISEMQLHLFKVTVYVNVALFILVGSALLIALIKFREKPGDEDKPYPSQSHGNPLVEVSLIAGSILCLVIIAVPTVKGIWMQEVLPDVPEEEIIEVNVKGWQWWWSFEYPAYTREDGTTLTTANELVIPKGKVVKLNLRSADVIHSFWLPKIAGKVDLMPGRQNWMWIQADEEGHYYGQCAEFCGESHAYMLIRADVLSEDGFESWVDQQLEVAAPPKGSESWTAFYKMMSDNPEAVENDPVLNGARLFMSGGGCIQCHTISGSQRAESGILGPNLTHVGSRSAIGAGLLENRDMNGVIDPEQQLDNLQHWIYRSDEVKPGNLMYRQVRENFKNANITEEDARDIAAYLQTLK